MINTSFETVYCVRQPNQFFKIILPYTKSLPASIPVIIKNEDMRGFEKELLHIIGFLAGSCVRKGIIVEEIEIILPPMGEYLFLQEKLQGILNNEGHKFSVSIGLQIDLPNTKLEDIDIDMQLDLLSKKNAGNN